MVGIPFVPQAYDRGSFGLPVARLQNLYVEKTGAGPTETARLPRPGLVETYEYGSGPVRGIFTQAGVFSGAVFIVSGTTLYKNGVSAGTVPGSGLVRIAASDSELVIVAAGEARTYDGSTLTLIDSTALPSVSDVVFLDGRFVYSGQDTGRIYWSAVGDASSIYGLAFATAEANPDPIIGLATDGDILVIFGSSSVELWTVTGDDGLPFQRISGGRYSRGCAAQGSIAYLDNATVWIGDDRVIYRGGSEPRRISTHGVEAALARCTSISTATAFEALTEGHRFLVVNIPGETSFAYDVSTETWAEWTSYGRTTFRGCCSVLSDGSTLVGDASTGQVFTLTAGVFTDDGSIITFLASAFIAANIRTRCDSVTLQGARGVGLSTGQGSAPITEIRWSDDGGRTWGAWRQASPGAVGDYRARAQWRRLGLIREPGRAFEVRTTDPVLASMFGLLMNEAAIG